MTTKIVQIDQCIIYSGTEILNRLYLYTDDQVGLISTVDIFFGITGLFYKSFIRKWQKQFTITKSKSEKYVPHTL